MKRHKTVAYFATRPHEDFNLFYHEIYNHCLEEKERGYQELDLLAVFHDLDKDDHDDLPAWDQLVTFLLVNKDVKRVLLPRSSEGLLFDGYDCILDMQEFFDLPLVTSWFINDNQDPRYYYDEDEDEDSSNEYRFNDSLLEINDEDIPF